MTPVCSGSDSRQRTVQRGAGDSPPPRSDHRRSTSGAGLASSQGGPHRPTSSEVRATVAPAGHRNHGDVTDTSLASSSSRERATAKSRPQQAMKVMSARRTTGVSWASPFRAGSGPNDGDTLAIALSHRVVVIKHFHGRTRGRALQQTSSRQSQTEPCSRRHCHALAIDWRVVRTTPQQRRVSVGVMVVNCGHVQWGGGMYPPLRKRGTVARPRPDCHNCGA